MNTNQASYYEQKALPKAQDTFLLRKDGYLPSPELMRAVDVALLLNKPLLVTGLPGTGKTDLAYHLAAHFDALGGEPLVFHTQSTSVAADLLYRYNSLAHFQYSQHQKNPLSPAEINAKYIDYEALGQAIIESKAGKRRVVLIDEIDKAPRDLPNDILDIVENMRFSVPELKTKEDPKMGVYEGDPDCKPLLILTSNSEKALPEPFLRRCLFFYIEQPTGEHLRKILKTKLDLPHSEKEWDAVIKAFEHIQQQLRGKKPATAELIQWAWWLHQQAVTPAVLVDTAKMDADKKALLHTSFSILAKDNDDWLRLQLMEIKL